jgi:NADH-quinone oxidoreductase subunit J
MGMTRLIRMTRPMPMRIAILIAAVALAACGGESQTPPSPAQAAAASVADDDGFIAAPCTRQVEVAARAALPGATRITCRTRKDASQRDGKTTERTPDDVRVKAVLPDSRVATIDMRDAAQPKVLSISYAHSDLSSSSGKGMALLFWAFALASVVGSLFVVTRRNLIAAVMGMVGSFLGIAAIYMMLYAQFIAVIQVLVYAGAIMVLFVFVVMILNRPEDEPVAPSGRAGQVLGGIAIIYLVARLILMLVRVEPPNPEVAMAAPPPLPPHCVAWEAIATGGSTCKEIARHDWGSIGAVGSDLFNAGLFPFEAISILLLVAVVGALAIARPLRPEEDEPAKHRAEGGAA